MMIRFVFLVAFFTSTKVFGQDVIKWGFSYSVENSTIEMKAHLAKGWYLYSQFNDPEAGPTPTVFQFSVNPQVIFTGLPAEPTPIKKMDDVFGTELMFFEKEVVFTQKIQSYGARNVSGKVTYMICNDVMCIPPTEEFFIVQLKN